MQREQAPRDRMMDGRICIVTGATAGIGYYGALEIARMGAAVTIIGRNEAKCIDSVKKIQLETGNATVEYLLVDLSSLEQVRTGARKFLEKHDRVDILVNNAGVFSLTRRLSADGYEMTFAVNHLGHFLLTNLLMEALKKGANSRVINVASGAHYNEHLDFDDLQLKKFYNPIKAYGRSKLANLLFTYELAHRLSGTNMTSNAMTPGMVATDMWKKVHPWLTPFISAFIDRRGQTPSEGAQTITYLATSPEVEGVTGKYYAYKHPIESSPLSHDPETARKLWDISLELVGLDEAQSI